MQTLELYQVIAENAPDAIKTGDIKQHFGRKVAIVSSRFQVTFKRIARKLTTIATDTQDAYVNSNSAHG